MKDVMYSYGAWALSSPFFQCKNTCSAHAIVLCHLLCCAVLRHACPTHD